MKAFNVLCSLDFRNSLGLTFLKNKSNLSFFTEFFLPNATKSSNLSTTQGSVFISRLGGVHAGASFPKVYLNAMYTVDKIN